MGVSQGMGMGCTLRSHARVGALLLAFLMALLLACSPQLARDAHAAEGGGSALQAADATELPAYAIL